MHIYMHIWRRAEMWKETETKSSEGRRTKPEPVEETVTVTAQI